MKTIVIHNAKGGVGSTLLAAAHCILPARDGIRVAGASLDANRDLPRFLERHGIPWHDATGDLPIDVDLLVLDVGSTTDLADVLRPDLLIMPMDNRTAYENAIRVAPSLHGPVVWVWSNVGLPEVTENRPVPESLASRVTFADQIILRDPAIATAADRFELACPECSGEAVRQIEALVRANLTRVGLSPSDEVYRAWGGTGHSAETPDEIPAHLHGQRRFEERARERLQAFFAR